MHKCEIKWHPELVQCERCELEKFNKRSSTEKFKIVAGDDSYIYDYDSEIIVASRLIRPVEHLDFLYESGYNW